MKINLRLFLFNVGFILIGISKLCMLNNGLDTALLILGLVMLLAKIMLDNFEKKQLIFIAGLISIGFFVFLKSQELNPITLIIVCFSLRKIDLDSAMLKFFLMNLITFLLIFTLCKLGIIYDHVYYYTRPGVIMERHSYGFGHPNQTFLRFFLICALLVTYFGKKHFAFKIALASIFSYLIYQGTKSRTGILGTVILLILVLLGNIDNLKWKKILSVGLMVVYWIVVIISLCFGFVENKLFDMFNSILTGRISLVKNYYMSHSITLFGEYKTITNSYVIDNSYMYMLIHYGLIFTIMYITIIGYLLVVMHKNNSINEIIAIVVLHIYAMSESVIINPMFNYCILFVGSIFMNMLKESKRENEIINNCTSI